MYGISLFFRSLRPIKGVLAFQTLPNSFDRRQNSNHTRRHDSKRTTRTNCDDSKIL